MAFTNNFASPDRATLFGISPATDQLARVGGADLADGGASQAAAWPRPIGAARRVDVDASAGLDIAANDNDAFAVLTPAGDTESGLYRINLVEWRRDVPPADVLGRRRLRGLALVSRAVKLYALSSRRQRARRRDRHRVERGSRHADAAPGAIVANHGPGRGRRRWR